MRLRAAARLLAGAAVFGSAAVPAHADNAMGYRLLSPREAAGLPHNHGALGLDVERAQEINDAGMTFELIRVKRARDGSAGARAGLHQGDEIIAVDGRVFPTLATFAAYIGALSPGARAAFDVIPAGGGPAQAERVPVVLGAPGSNAGGLAGLSTGEKVAIGVGAAALLGCYELGCFSHRGGTAPSGSSPPSGAQGAVSPAR